VRAEQRGVVQTLEVGIRKKKEKKRKRKKKKNRKNKGGECKARASWYQFMHRFVAEQVITNPKLHEDSDAEDAELV
jgi:hypothetical protein